MKRVTLSNFLNTLFSKYEVVQADGNAEGKKSVKKLNDALHKLTTNQYFQHLPLSQITDLLHKNGVLIGDYEGALEGIYVGKEGSINKQVAPNIYFYMSWYKMGSGNYEVVPRVSWDATKK